MSKNKTTHTSDEKPIDKFFIAFGARRFYNTRTKSISLKFSSKSPKVDPVRALTFKDEFNRPIKSISYQHILYRMEGNEHLIIEGKPNCASQINANFMDILSVFPTINKELRPSTLFVEEKPSKKIDNIKKITIKGNIKELTFSLDDPKGLYKSPFKNSYLRRPEGEDPVPYKFTNLETIDLSECTGLQKLYWEFLYNDHIKTLILPNHDFEVYGKDWIKEHNANCAERNVQEIEVQNGDHAKLTTEKESACNIA